MWKYAASGGGASIAANLGANPAIWPDHIVCPIPGIPTFKSVYILSHFFNVVTVAAAFYMNAEGTLIYFSNTGVQAPGANGISLGYCPNQPLSYYTSNGLTF